MRLSAVLGTAQGLGLHDHAGWAFAEPAEFRREAGRFLAEGLSAGERIVYVAGADTAGPLGVDNLDAALTSRQAQVTSVAAMYADGEPVDPGEQVTRFARAAEQAVADGWAGLRVAADATSLVRTEQQRRAWLRYEHLADVFMAHGPMAGFCGFHRDAVDAAALAEITCVHPALNAGCSQFRLYTAEGADVAIAGEIDRSDDQALAAALHARSEPRGDRLVVDVTRLAFVDHHGLALIARYAAGLGLPAVLHARAGSIAGTIASLVPMPALEVRVVSE